MPKVENDPFLRYLDSLRDYDCRSRYLDVWHWKYNVAYGIRWVDGARFVVDWGLWRVGVTIPFLHQWLIRRK